MSQTKVQLIAPIGVVTASTLETTGVLTATTFVGDIAGTVTGITSTTDNLNLGIITATSFAGDFTGIGSGLTGTPNVVAGVVTATKFVGNTPGTVSGIADGTNINAGIITATSFVGNLTGNAAGLSTTTAQVTLGIVTATSYHGSGANLSGVSAGAVAQQAVTADGATTTIDLSSGNLIYMTQSANTTVAFANTEGNTDVVYLARTKDDTTTARTITWPSGIVWDGGTEPTILNSSLSEDIQVFKLTTRDNGATWYGTEVVNNGSGYDLYSWGDNTQGALGINVYDNSNDYYRSSPAQVPGSTWTSVFSAYKRAFGIKSDGTLWAWGNGGDGPKGQLAQNDAITYSSPVQIPGTTWHSVSSAQESGMATKTDGTLWAWGDNEYGALGQNNLAEYSSPVQVPGTTWASAQMCWNFAAAIKTDGTLWAFGYNNYGQLGQNNRTHYSSPVQIPGTTWRNVDGGPGFMAATKTDNTIWSIGENHVGQLGDNTIVTRSSPVQLPGTTWKDLWSGGYCTAAIKTDGTLWSWGTNGNGVLAQNNLVQYSSPVQIPGTSWSTVTGNQATRYATKTNGELWVWGWNERGQLGQNTGGPSPAHSKSSPTQVPGTNWVTTPYKWNASGARGANISALKNS